MPRWHGLMESGVEDAHLRQARHQLLHSVHALQVGGIVQGSQVGALLKLLQHLVGQDDALVELLAAMHHAVAYGVNLLQVFDDANLRIGQKREDKLNALGMLRDVVHNLALLSIGQLHLHEGTVQTDTLSATTCHHTLVVHVVQCILDAGRATIQN